MRQQIILIQGIILLILFSIFSCQQDNKPIDPNAKMFKSLPAYNTGVDFNNEVSATLQFNHFFWQSIYNGAGVGIGDVNNDGLPDLYFTGNKERDRLYLNKGNFKFEDITLKAGIKDDGFWSTGVTMGDVNNDGHLDIYVCRHGPYLKPLPRQNLLYINDGKGNFKERGAAYGLNHGGFSTQATFFDYDKDGDLDVYLVNQPPDKRVTNSKRFNINTDDPTYSDRLFRNDGNIFTDVSQQAGIKNYAYGLNVVASDINEDGFVDIYVSNDYEMPDMFYINNGNGTFTDKSKEYLKHVSFYSMGSDIADYNNDGLLDIAVVDMAAEDHYRAKTNMESMDIDRFWEYVDKGRHYQYMFNTLQLNNGNGSFSEVAQLAGVSKTDWSWAVLMADFDNDFHKDMYITNGIKKDIRNSDATEKLKQEIQKGNKKFNSLELVKALPSFPISNYMYKNKGDLSFENNTTDWGLNVPGFSNGAAYGDLDGDGDLDLVVSNIGEPASIFENVKGSMNNYLSIKLEGPPNNKLGLNTKVELHYGDDIQIQELTLTRGYLSSCEPLLHFGLKDVSKIDLLKVEWPDGKVVKIEGVDVNQKLTLKHSEGQALPREKVIAGTWFEDFSSKAGYSHKHTENEYNDFDREILIPHKQSQNGPGLAAADINGDGQEDFFIGGALGYSGQLYLGSANGFQAAPSQPWEADKGQEDTGALFFDADADNDLDLYVVSGGSEYAANDQAYQDRLYLNDGNGNFSKAANALPKMLTSGKSVTAGDMDQDGDMDLFVGGRIIPGKYPKAPKSYLLLNEGGRFRDATESIAPDLSNPGLVTASIFTDYDGDKDLDLIVVGEWMPISFFENKDGQFTNTTTSSGVDHSNGWWWSIAEGDFNKDGKMDYAVGNLGKNTKFKAGKNKPFVVFGNDFDDNGTNDIVLASYSGDKLLPVRGRECTSEQMPFVAEKFPTYDAFAKATIETIYSPDELNQATRYEVHSFKSVVLINAGDGSFELKAMPLAAQVSPIRGMEITDVNKDGNPDILGVGNLYQAEVETIRYDAGIGICLLGDGQGNFESAGVKQTGFFAPDDARAIVVLKSKPLVLVANNDDQMQFFNLR